MKTERIVLGLPWYGGPDVDTFPLYFEHLHYYGRLRERAEWVNWVGQKYGLEAQTSALAELPLLDTMGADRGRCEWNLSDDTILEFRLADETRHSLPGVAREFIVERALADNADWVFFWDYDMKFSWGSLLALWRHRKPVCAALAFTAREPIQPVIYRIREEYDKVKGTIFYSDWVYDYPKDQLVSGADINGSLAFGAGAMLVNTNVFREISKPWFHSTGCGEDWMFCVRCHVHGVQRYVDTSIKTLHKMHRPQWIGEQEYLAMREERPDVYAKLMGGQNGKSEEGKTNEAESGSKVEVVS